MISSHLASKIILKALEKTEFGSVKISTSDDKNFLIGNGPLVTEVKLKRLGILSEIARGGDIALGEAILTGDIEIENEAAFIEWACRNDQALKPAFHGTFLGTLTSRLKSLLRKNTVTGAKRNIQAHYDLGNDFYESWLDPSMSYSSALFKDAAFEEELTAAQYNKYDRIIDQLQIKSSDHVLEIGCGWGGFFSRAVERTGCKVTAVMNSPAQAAHNTQLISRKQMGNNVNLIQTDYRNIEGKYDKVVSIEMIEAVGHEFWSTYFEKVSSSLKSRGKAVIQSITITENRFEDYLRNPDFISTYIFPGGKLLTNTVIDKNAQAQGMACDKPFEFGLSYAETLRRWRGQFHYTFKNGNLKGFDDRFYRLWHFYLSYCEGAFLAKRINVAQFSLEKTI
jgi:cyclopropane-fatty-acyl-phospholipid synthase